MTESRPSQKPIAVVGVGGIFPGALDVRAFWKNILEGADLVTDLPKTHWQAEHYYDPDPKKPDMTYCKRGAFLPEVPFDSLAYGMPPSLLSSTDTSQLLGLLVARTTLDDATGGRLDEIDRSRISVLLGVTSGQELFGQMAARLAHPHWRAGMRAAGIDDEHVEEAMQKIAESMVPWTEATFPGLLGNVVAGRIANRLDLGGTNAVTDAACASSFAAVSMAIDELVLGRADLALTGGVDTLSDIFMYMCFSKTPALSATGDCRPFDEKADGTLLGEGLGMVALKRLEDAERDGDHIYAVIRGLGTSSDGRSKSVYAPVSEGQANAIRRAYDAAGYSPATVELVEAHGTGTKAGDVAEVGGLKLAFGETDREDAQWCALGSVKSQIGHTKAAAGSAGLLKIVLALHHKVLPPTIKVDKPNPKLGLEDSPFYVSREARPWVRSADHPRRASVSSFGFGGSNFHIAVEEYTGPGKRAPRLIARPAELFCLSAPSEEGLKQRVTALRGKAKGTQPAHASLALASLAKATQEAFVTESEHRLAFSASSLGDLDNKLGLCERALDKPASERGRVPGVHFGSGAREGKLALLFPGQGSQYVGMGASAAMHLDAVRAAFDAADGTALGDKPLSRVVFPPPAFDDETKARQALELTRTEWAQPALGALEAGLYAELCALGLTPDMVAGHSFGELTALYAAGVLDLPSLLKTARKRGELMATASGKKGAMAAVSGPVEKVRALVAEMGADDLVLANENAPDQAVLSGAEETVLEASKRLEAAGLRVKRLDVSTAFHSPLVADASGPLLSFLEGVPFAAPRVPVFANMSAAPYPEGADEARRLLAEQVQRPVRFVDEIEAMYAAGARTFVEVGPGSVLTGLVSRILKGRPHVAVATDAKGRDSVQSLFDALAQLLAAGVALDMKALWDSLEPPALPEPAAKKPGLVVELNGANTGKPALPTPKPAAAKPVERRVAAPVPATPGPATAPARVPSQPTAPSPPSSSSPGASAPALSPTRAAVPAMSDSLRRPSAPTLSPAPASRPVAPAGGWLEVFREGQRQTAEAHAAFQRSMADAHVAFLQAFEQSSAQLAGLLSGAPVEVAAPVRAAPVVATPVVAAPVVTAPVVPALAPAPAPSINGANGHAYGANGHANGHTNGVNGSGNGHGGSNGAFPRAAPSPAALAAPAPAPVVAPTPAAAAPLDVRSVLLDVVAEKTGYPKEALAPEMSLEADLGIDSIKRVEILGAIKERLPGAPELDAMQLAQLSTLGEIAGALEKSLPAAPSASAPRAPAAIAAGAPAATGADVNSIFLDVVAEKTGYPKEALAPEMGLEADLGIDSIKRVEILGAVKERLPNAPELDAMQLAQLSTLGEIAKALGGAPSAPASTNGASTNGASTNGAPPNGATGVDVASVFLDVVAEKTGYPKDALNLDMSLEADLGIDSIKRVEILGAMKERVPGAPELDAMQLAQLATLGEIAKALTGAQAGAAPQAEGATRPFEEGAIERAELSIAPLSPARAPLALPAGARFALVADDRGVAEALAERLEARGFPAIILRSGEGVAAARGASALVHLAALSPVADDGAALARLRDAFAVTHELARDLMAAAKSGAAFVTVQDTGGDFGFTAPPRERALTGGLAGLAKTAAQEWPGVVAKAIDIDTEGLAADDIAARLEAEIFEGHAALEVGLSGRGAVTPRVALSRLASPLPLAVTERDVIVATGGARGVTAVALEELCRAARPALVLLGRTDIDAPVPAGCDGVTDEAALKRALFAEATSRGEKVTPVEIGNRAARVLAAQEIRAQLRRFEALGARARYYAVDVRDADALGHALDDARKAFGPITGLVHGAGVLADRRIEDKTLEQYDRVLDTKVGGLLALLEATARDPLRLISLFSSVAGRYGNVGQCDYAMANEALNKLAHAERQRRGPSCVVKSMNWGPWEGGMVTPALKKLFEERGVALLPLSQGARFFVEELSVPAATGAVEVVFGGPLVEERAEPVAPATSRAPAGPLVVTRRVDAGSFDYLEDHSLRGVPVLPVVLALDFLAGAAREARPDLVVRAVRDLRVVRGVKLSHFNNGGNELHVVLREIPAEGSARTRAAFQVELVTPGERAPHYTAVVELGREPLPLTDAPTPPPLEPYPASREDIYGQLLFHGPRFQLLERIEGVSRDAMVAEVRGTLLSGWPGARWEVDAAALDAGLQVLLLYARHACGGAFLPTGFEAYLPHAAAPLGAGLRAVLLGRELQAERVLADLLLVDDKGRAVVELRGVSAHRLLDDTAFEKAAPAAQARVS